MRGADEEDNKSIGAKPKVHKATVGKWRTSLIPHWIGGLYDAVRPDAVRTIDDEKLAQLIKATLHNKPTDGSTHWSVREVAAQTGISKSSVQR